MTKQPQLKPGDEVDVPWGLDTFHGIVVDVRQTATETRVRVRLDSNEYYDDDDNPRVITVPLEDLIESDSVASEFAEKGSWLRLEEYEQQVREALKRAAASQELSSTIQSRPAADSGIDVLIKTPSVDIVVIVKWQLREFRLLTARLTDQIADIERTSSRRTAGLIIAPNAPRAIVSPRHFGPFQLTTRLTFTRWQGTADDNRLSEALGMAVSGSRVELPPTD